MTPQDRPPGESRGHLAKAFRWSPAPLDPLDALAAALAMATPVLAGVLLGAAPAGFLAALGALALTGPVAAPDCATHARRLGVLFASIGAAVCMAAIASGHGAATGVALVLLASAAALVGGASRPLAEATTRFIVFLAIAASALDNHASRASFVALTLAGALWAAFITLVAGALARAMRNTPSAEATPQRAAPTARQQFARWRKTLRRLDGWRFTLRLAACLSCAYGLHALWPNHHLPWIAVTAVILLQRQVEPLPVRTTQRALGVAGGVCLAAVLTAGEPPHALLVMGVALLAGLRPLLRVKNYLAYSAIMTPLVVLMIDAGAPPTWSLLRDRLVATLIGAALVLAVNAVALRGESIET